MININHLTRSCSEVELDNQYYHLESGHRGHSHLPTFALATNLHLDFTLSSGASCVYYSYAYAYLLFASSIWSRNSGFHPLLLVLALPKCMIQHWSCSWSKSVFVSHHSISRKEGNSCISIVHSQIYTNLLFHQLLLLVKLIAKNFLAIIPWRPVQANTFTLPLPLPFLWHVNKCTSL